MKRLSMTFVFSYLLTAISSTVVLAAPGDVLDLQAIGSQSAAQIDAEKASYVTGSAPSLNGVSAYKVTYETMDLSGLPTPATGLILFPDSSAGAGPFPVVSYQHQTSMTRTLVPSNLSSGMALPALFLFGARGYVVAAADYLGLGDSPGIHPYLHAKTEASATADLLRATRKVAQKLGIGLGPQLFLTGYSQGGHATMALHRYLEESLSSEFSVTASAPGAGAYDLSHTTLQTILKTSVPASVAELGYLIQSMRAAYGIYPSLGTEIVASTWWKLPVLFDGNHLEGSDPSQAGTILNGLAPVTAPQELFQPDTLSAIQSGKHNELEEAFAKNDVYQWVPKAPVQLYYSEADQEVPPQNSVIAYNWMKAHGADVQLISLGNTMDHITAMTPALKEAAIWFDTLRTVR